MGNWEKLLFGFCGTAGAIALAMLLVHGIQGLGDRAHCKELTGFYYHKYDCPQ